jgi:hypothetical protein
MTTETTLAQVHAEGAATVHAAEQEAQEATALVEALEEKVRDGDDAVTPEELASARELGRFARLRAEAAQRKADRARQAARLAACEELRREIEQYADGSGERFAELLRDVETAVRAFIGAVEQRNTHLRTWRQRMHQLGVPAHRSPSVRPAEHGHLGHDPGNSELIAGRRRLRPTDPDRPLGVLLRRITDDYEAKHRQGLGPQIRLDLAALTYAHRVDPYAELAKIDEPDR